MKLHLQSPDGTGLEIDVTVTPYEWAMIQEAFPGDWFAQVGCLAACQHAPGEPVEQVIRGVSLAVQLQRLGDQ